MSDVDTTVRENIITYPQLFQSRNEVMAYILAVEGNGYVWQDGEAVSVEPLDEPWTRKKAVQEERRRLRDTKVDRRLRTAYKKEVNAAIDEWETIVSEVEHRVHYIDDIERPVDTFGKNILLNSVPDDIKPDWAIEVANLKAALAATK